ncbi:GNAT family N-acetyltransferase [Labedella endophytica]|uniref:GNAT family N-acetyltransferase n=1 Tax=Labedella endophytica TaxID=1523160 RepID=A0A3S0WYV5_9MICO|nr:GNAT family N-acetyltransferase [Labedella endophytica]RUR01458.1 GNAT family N-acetyltransferase [Labedella endophytica]
MADRAARVLAERAAAVASVEIVSVSSPEDAAETVGMFSSVWGKGRGADPSTLQAIAHAGNPVLLARRDGDVLGALFSFIGWDDGLHVHSHMTAVGPVLRSAGVGFALKLAQRAECLENGITEVRWTYDPLIRRNARFNLWKLGAVVSAFRPDFYGVLDDAVNGTDRSDRFEVSWRLDAPGAIDALAGRPTRPMRSTRPDDVALPEDFEAVRRDDPATAAALRESSRDLFARSIRVGTTVRFTGTGYVFDRAEAATHQEETR